MVFKSKDEEILVGDSGYDCATDHAVCISTHCCGDGVPLKATFDTVKTVNCQHKDSTQFWHQSASGSLLKMSFKCISGSEAFKLMTTGSAFIALAMLVL